MKYDTIEKQQDALLKPFYEEEIEWRIARYGSTPIKGPWAMCLAYVTSRAVMDRLDDVFGIGNWQDSYDVKDDGIICTIAVRFVGSNNPNEWISKSDGAQKTKVEPFKGGLSDAIKRTAVKFGIGRYLYHLEEGFAEVSVDRPSNWKVDGWKMINDKETKTTFYWKAPKLPDWALPKEGRAK